jgi:hypothetical protein
MGAAQRAPHMKTETRETRSCEMLFQRCDTSFDKKPALVSGWCGELQGHARIVRSLFNAAMKKPARLAAGLSRLCPVGLKRAAHQAAGPLPV